MTQEMEIPTEQKLFLKNQNENPGTEKHSNYKGWGITKFAGQ